MATTSPPLFPTARRASGSGRPALRERSVVLQDLELNASERERLERGDRALLQRLLTALFPLMHRWLYRTLADKTSVDDAMQEALIELTRALPSFRGEAKLTTFAHRITMRVAYRYFHRAKLLRTEESPWDGDATDSRLEGKLLARSELTLIHQLLDRLSEGRRAAFLLCDVEGLSPMEAADLVGIPALVMRSRLCRARADIKKLLESSHQNMVLSVGIA